MRLKNVVWLIFCAPAFSQWPDTPVDNVVVCNANGEQAISKMVALDDGSCYVSWFDNRSGGYDVYMQYLDSHGNPQWEENGLLVADRNYSSTMDYGLTTDSEGNAVVVYRKEVVGGDGVVVSSVSQSGIINWHTVVQTGSSFVASPVICTSSNFLFVGWIGNDDSKIQKLNNKGVMQWEMPTTMTDPDGGYYFLTDIQPSLKGDVIASFVQYLTFTGNKRLKAQRIKSDGSLAWSSQSDVMTTNSLQFGNFPDFISDGQGGGFFTWYGVGPLQCYATRISSDGFKWFAGEVQVAVGGNSERVNPVATRDGDEYVVFFTVIENNQNSDGIGAQRFSSNGGLLWGNSGVELKPVSSSPQYASFTSALTNEGVVLAFTESPSFGNDVISALSVNQKGAPTWFPETLSIASTPSSKSKIVSSATGDGVLLAWQDNRSGQNDIYAQRLNSDGTLGNAANCLGDVNGDEVVGVTDILDVIAMWGDCPKGGSCDADVNSDGVVNVSDILIVIGEWGDCS